jgi:hypothetical protein
LSDSVAVKIDVEQFVELYQSLNDKFKGKHQHRCGLKENVTYYSIVWCEPNDDSCLCGHISGPEKNNAKFKFIRKGNTVSLLIDEDKDCNVPIARLVDEINDAIANVRKKVLFPPEGGFGTSNWRGYYLKRSNTPLSKTVVSTLSKAVADKEINSNFKDSCMNIGIGMVRYS